MNYPPTIKEAYPLKEETALSERKRGERRYAYVGI
jgi:hypothetical protein